MKDIAFSFETSDEAYEFCKEIVEYMIRKFGITKEESVGRINEEFMNNDFIDEDDLRFHESDKYWAHLIYYGHNSLWWRREGDPTLKPVPYHGTHMNFTFKTNERSHEFCVEIVMEMVTSFGISQEEALGRVNRAWSRGPFVEELDLRYHEDTDYWAYQLYYGNSSECWNREGDPTLRPLPYP
ncbi:hypothetical protein JJB07_21100 [Tumebacillus sp. ITR2]|uniref:Uncharacterized protein n=1 Tax=Tumebacillus amylolyticus TaxID=2801339 RepID=A0ABS1JFM7_9BACL|nr:hypothetical protein [Tumebacillus amylolyticus]MBL0389095.1 hypothetical protein [Tumebacillus amylolyticus]